MCEKMIFMKSTKDIVWKWLESIQRIEHSEKAKIPAMCNYAFMGQGLNAPTMDVLAKTANAEKMNPAVAAAASLNADGSRNIIRLATLEVECTPHLLHQQLADMLKNLIS